MRKTFLGIFILTLIIGCDTYTQTKKKSMIPLDDIEGMYSKLKADGVNTDKEMLYGYFFVSGNKKKLEETAKELKLKNFRLVDIYQNEDNSDWWLNVERIEIHNPNSLFNLNKELYELADKFKIDYDGYELGNADPSKPIERDTYVVAEEFKFADFDKDDYPLLLIGNTAFDRFPHKEEFCYFLKVTTKFDHDENVMLPSDAELESLDQFENFIESNLTQNGVKNYYVYRDTHKGIRNFYMAVKDNVGTEQIMKLIKEKGKQRDFEFCIIEDKNWDLYNEIRPKLNTE